MERASTGEATSTEKFWPSNEHRNSQDRVEGGLAGRGRTAAVLSREPPLAPARSAPESLVGSDPRRRDSAGRPIAHGGVRGRPFVLGWETSTSSGERSPPDRTRPSMSIHLAVSCLAPVHGVGRTPRRTSRGPRLQQKSPHWPGKVARRSPRVIF